MKKMITRIAACSLAVLIAFNTFAIPRSKAVIVESALVTAFVATYSAAAGLSYRGESFPGVEQMPAVVGCIETFIEDFSEAREMTRAQFEEELNKGVEIIRNGVISFSSAAANLLGDFTDWLIDKLGLIGEDGIPVTDSVPLIPNYIGFPPLFSTDVTTYPVIILWYNPDTGVYRSYYSGVGSTIMASNSDTFVDSPDSSGRYAAWDPDKASWVWFSESEGILTITNKYIVASSVNIVSASGNVIATATDVSQYSGIEDWSAPSLSVSLVPVYEAPPKVEEQYSMVINPGMTFADEQEFIDAVLGGVAAGTLAPTYELEYTGNRDVIVPGEVTDTQAGLLSWVKTIAQRVASLPQSIAEAVKGIFVPDAALTTEITGAFASKFSFVPTLHRLGTDLLSIGPDSKPPVVYIHLEDAEGMIDYGGTVKALDMSWYERYKEDGDRIIGGFLWLGFLWLLFKRVPAIINGGEMVQEYTADIDRGSKRRKQ